jgi:hypothetical protein
MLVEEPVGLLSMAGILHGSDVNTMVSDLVKEPDFNGKTREVAMREDGFDQRRYHFHKRQKSIVWNRLTDDEMDNLTRRGFI